ncbi:MAG: S9 family peptidase, partial [Phycisphaerales bacterium]|nr:S9 family peptidase [Phycisphaerales bacterium]
MHTPFVFAAVLTGAAAAAWAEPPKPAGEKPAAAQAPQVPLISRQTLFGNPDQAAPQISPDGKQIAFLRPAPEGAEGAGVLNVFIAPADNLAAAKQVTRETKRPIRQFFWAYTGGHLLYMQDQGGNENFNLFRVDLKSGDVKNLTPFPNVQARVEASSEKFPGDIILGINNRDPRFHDVYRVNIATGDSTLIYQNTEWADITVDDDYKVRFASRFNPDGSVETFRPGEGEKWESFMKVAAEDSLTTGLAGFDKTGQVVYMRDSRGRDTGAFVSMDLKTNQTKVIAESPKADAGGASIHPTERTVQAVAFNHLRNQWTVVDPSVKADFEQLRGVADGDFSISSRSLDDQRWIVSYTLDNGPVKWYLYDRTGKSASFLFSNKKELENQPLVKLHPVVIKSRDGLDLVSYLSIPLQNDPKQTGRPDRPVPMVLVVHGGPWARDGWGYNPQAQWLSNRGYAVLMVNFRGSTGFGKSFVNAGNMEWAAKMHDDLIDAVNWAVAEKIADPKKVAIMGGSYGGYATLVGLTFTPEVFAAGVSIVGPSNLNTLLESIPPYWIPIKKQFQTRVGDSSTPEGKKLLEERSPLSRVEKIVRPLLIGQGANDPRVKQAESDQIVAAMQKRSIPVAYVLYPDEGHGFARPQNRMSFNAVVEAFLAEHLGGRFEPVGKDFAGSSITIPAGGEHLPGMADALKV